MEERDARRPALVEIVNGKALYNGRSLAAWVPDVVRRIFDRTDAERVIVFGSVERGDDGPDSDIDVVVVLPKISRRHVDAVDVLRQLRDVPVPVDVIVADGPLLEEASDSPGILRIALRQGRVLNRSD